MLRVVISDDAHLKVKASVTEALAATGKTGRATVVLLIDKTPIKRGGAHRPSGDRRSRSHHLRCRCRYPGDALSRRRASTIWRFRAGIEAVWSKGGYQLEEAMAEGSTRMVAATIEKMKPDGCAAKAPR